MKNAVIIFCVMAGACGVEGQVSDDAAEEIIATFLSSSPESAGSCEEQKEAHAIENEDLHSLVIMMYVDLGTCTEENSIWREEYDELEVALDQCLMRGADQEGGYGKDKWYAE